MPETQISPQMSDAFHYGPADKKHGRLTLPSKRPFRNVKKNSCFVSVRPCATKIKDKDDTLLPIKPTMPNHF